MTTQKRAAGADLWSVVAEGTGKLTDIHAEPHVNLAYYKDRTREWVSVSGLATLSRDRDKMRGLYAPDWSMWFGERGIRATARRTTHVSCSSEWTSMLRRFSEVSSPQPVVLYESVKGFLTGDAPEIGETQRIER